MKQYPNKMSVTELKKVKTLKDFDDIYTSKAHVLLRYKYHQNLLKF